MSHLDAAGCRPRCGQQIGHAGTYYNHQLGHLGTFLNHQVGHAGTYYSVQTGRAIKGLLNSLLGKSN